MSWLSAVVAVVPSIVPVVATLAPSPSAWYGSPSGCAPPDDVPRTAVPHCSDHSTAFRLHQSSWLTRMGSSDDGQYHCATNPSAPALHRQSCDRTPCRRGCTTRTVPWIWHPQWPWSLPIAYRLASSCALVGISICSYHFALIDFKCFDAIGPRTCGVT